MISCDVLRSSIHDIWQRHLFLWPVPIYCPCPHFIHNTVKGFSVLWKHNTDIILCAADHSLTTLAHWKLTWSHKSAQYSVCKVYLGRPGGVGCYRTQFVENLGLCQYQKWQLTLWYSPHFGLVCYLWIISCLTWSQCCLQKQRCVFLVLPGQEILIWLLYLWQVFAN